MSAAIGAALVVGFAAGVLVAHEAGKLRRKLARKVRRWAR